MNTITVTNGTTKTNFDEVAKDTWEIWQCVDESTGEWVLIATVEGDINLIRTKC
jgi:hypothetical protein